MVYEMDLTIPKTITSWLGRRILLYKVPFRYLIPDEVMLPKGSIRFFYLDPGWLNCLLDGACSVGRSSDREQRIDAYLRSKFLGFALEESSNVRTRTMQENGNVEDTVNISKNPVSPNWPLTGFLLRSPVVEGWQGLELRAWADSGDQARVPLDPLRIDRLAPDIMLCIFNGKVQRIKIKQPPEGMHFGAERNGSGYKKYHFRSIIHCKIGNKNYEPGDQLDDASKIGLEIQLRKGDHTRVVDVKKLATDIEMKLQNSRNQTPLNSAEFAVQMVESPGCIVFDINNLNEKNNKNPKNKTDGA